MKYDAVFEGGGLKGIGLAGAVCELERHGYEIQNCIGTSAGAIVASMLAAGYTGKQIKNELENVDFKSFRQEDFLSRLFALGKTLKILFKFGIYKTDNFELWLSELLAKKGVFRFSDLEGKRGWFRAVASDISTQSLLVLPDGLENFGFDPLSFSVAKAVKMSMSIPIFFEPMKINDIDGNHHYIADGGMLSNYPIWLMDEKTRDSSRPVFGFRFTNPNHFLNRASSCTINNITDYIKSIAGTAMDAHDNYYVSGVAGDKQRTIFISTVVNTGGADKNIRTTDFDITKEESNALFANGERAAREFLKTWNHKTWKASYR